MKPEKYVAGFDSAESMLKALSSYLQKKGYANMGNLPGFLATPLAGIASALNRLPGKTRQKLYIAASGAEGMPASRLDRVESESLSRLAVRQYPARRYPAMMIGSSNGAAIHLCAALGIPWLPQSFLIPLKSGLSPHEPRKDMEWAREPARRLLNANPDLQLHHMLDPVQDLLTSSAITYFRVKKRTLGKVYERFIEEHLEPGGTLFVLDCRLQWPVKQVEERHYFQFGALGGAALKDYFKGTSKTRDYLEAFGDGRKRWDPPAPDKKAPEAEWGYAPEMDRGLEELARRKGYKVSRIVYNDPVELSPLTADLYRAWYEHRGVISRRLLAGNFILFEPYWTLKTGAVPFWTVFPTRPYDDRLEDYIRESGPFDDIGLMLFSHGVESIGLVPAQRWRQILKHAKKQGVFVGTDEAAYPQDLATHFRYHPDLKKKFRARFPLPGYLSLDFLDRFLRAHASKYRVQWDGYGTRVRGKRDAKKRLQAA